MRIAVLLALALGLAALVSIRGGAEDSSSMEQQITATELAFNPHALKVTKTEDKVGWYFYKVAIPVSKR